MTKYKVYYTTVIGKELRSDIVKAEGFTVDRGVLIFFERGGGTHNTFAYKDWLRVTVDD